MNEKIETIKRLYAECDEIEKIISEKRKEIFKIVKELRQSYIGHYIRYTDYNHVTIARVDNISKQDWISFYIDGRQFELTKKDNGIYSFDSGHHYMFYDNDHEGRCGDTDCTIEIITEDEFKAEYQKYVDLWSQQNYNG